MGTGLGFAGMLRLAGLSCTTLGRSMSKAAGGLRAIIARDGVEIGGREKRRGDEIVVNAGYMRNKLFPSGCAGKVRNGRLGRPSQGKIRGQQVWSCTGAPGKARTRRRRCCALGRRRRPPKAKVGPWPS